MPDRIDTTDVRRLTAHCRRCRHRIGEFRSGALRLDAAAVRVKLPAKLHCERCGHTWWESRGGGYDGDVPRTSGG